MEQEIIIEMQHLLLSPFKAIFWREQKMLVISDVHLGKISHFRKNGIAVPREALNDNFKRLDHLILHFDAYEILFLGDLFHSELNEEWEMFCRWRSKYHSIIMGNVCGNHDILPEQLYCDSGITSYYTAFIKQPFIFTHHPLKNPDKDYNIAGHIHPVIKVKGIAKQGLRLPCFYFGSGQALLPSFGTFTGGYAIETISGDRVFGVTKDAVIPVY